LIEEFFSLQVDQSINLASPSDEFLPAFACKPAPKV